MYIYIYVYLYVYLHVSIYIYIHISGRTPLHQSASRGHLACAKKLIENGADPHLKDFPYKPDVSQVV